MKKDKRFLTNLEKELTVLKPADRDFVLDKYRNIIDEGLASKKKITVILKEIGPVKEVAEKEIALIKSKEKEDNIFRRFFGFISKDLTAKKSEEDDEKKKEKAKLKEEKKLAKEALKKEKEELKAAKKLAKENEKEEKRKLKEELKNASNEEKKELKKASKEQKRFLKEEQKKLKEQEKEEKKKVKKEKKNIVKETIEDIEEVVPETIEKIEETHIFESKEVRRKRIILTTLGTILTILLIFIWLWVTVLAIACGFAYLDGVKFVGLIIAAFAADLLLLWIVVMINRAVFHKKNRVVLNLIISFVCVGLIALGIVLFVRKLNSIEKVEDVSEKYSMTTKYDTYIIPSDTNKKLNFVFNANYKTQYVVDYDENMLGKVKVEVKYYEAYYDYFIKKSSNIVYISLKVDSRDRLSTYISDIKDGVIYDTDEMSRYLVKITMAKEDAGRIEIMN